LQYAYWLGYLADKPREKVNDKVEQLKTVIREACARRMAGRPMSRNLMLS
jgi:hypothetical protein